MKDQIVIMLSIFLLINLCNTKFIPSGEIKGCNNPCQACQIVVSNLKFHRQVNCPNYHCGAICNIIWDLWKSPQSPFFEFQNDSLGKCNICSRVGFCSMTECNPQSPKDNYIINRLIKNKNFNDLFENPLMKESFEKIMREKKIEIENKINPNIQNKFVGNKLSKLSKSLKLLANVQIKKRIK